MKKQVAVVEDNPNIRELIEYLLEDKQFDVVSFGTATTFLSNVTDIRPDLYLLDIMLPDGNGIDLCRQLKTNQETCKKPVILMSAHYDEIHPECEAADFIAKPFDINHFISRVEQHIA